MQSSTDPVDRAPTPNVATKQLSNYTPLSWLGAANTGRNSVLLMHKTKESEDKIWFCKLQGSHLSENEYQQGIAGEFCRLLNPAQPKTRIIRPNVGGAAYLASKGMQNFETFEEIETRQEYEADQAVDSTESSNKRLSIDAIIAERLASREYVGYGRVQIEGRLVGDADRNRGNYGVLTQVINNQVVRQVVQIDFGFAFDRTREEQNFPEQNITERFINHLPFDDDIFYEASWGRYVCSQSSRAVDAFKSLQTNIEYKREVYSSSLRSFLLSAELIDELAASYAHDRPDLAEKYASQLKINIQQLRVALKDNDEFKIYLGSDLAAQEVEIYWSYLDSFHTTSKKSLVHTTQTTKTTIVDTFNALRQDYAATIKKLPTVLITFQDCIEFVKIHAESSTQYQPCTQVDSDNRLDDMRKSLAEFMVLAKKMKALKPSLAQAGEIVNVALACHYSYVDLLYSCVCWPFAKQDVSGFILPLVGLYSDFQAKIDAFITASKHEDSVAASEDILQFMQLNKHIFLRKQYNRYLDAIDIGLGFEPEWYVDVSRVSELYSSHHIQSVQSVAQVLYLLGFKNELVYQTLSPAFMSYVLHPCFHFNRRKICKPNKVYTLKNRNLNHLTAFFQAKYATDLPDSTRHTSLEQFVDRFRVQLALCEFKSGHDRQLVDAIRKYKHSVTANEFNVYIRKFFLDSDYEYGFYSILATRQQFSLIVRPRISRLMGMVFISINSDADVNNIPLLTLLLDLSPNPIKLNEMLTVCEFGFDTSSLKTGYLSRKLGFKANELRDTSTARLFPEQLRGYVSSEAYVSENDLENVAKNKPSHS